jgi:hypothetical protein
MGVMNLIHKRWQCSQVTLLFRLKSHTQCYPSYYTAKEKVSDFLKNITLTFNCPIVLSHCDAKQNKES